MKLGPDRVAYDNKRLRVTEFAYTPQGGEERTWVAVRMPEVSAVLAYHKDGTITLVEQPRPVVKDDHVLEMPAGLIDEGETPEQAAYRELEEETGLRAGNMRFLGSVWSSPGVCDELVHLFIATNFRPGVMAQDTDERINVKRLSIAEVRVMIRDGKIRGAKLIASLGLAGIPVT